MSKKRDSQPLYVPKGKTRGTNKTEPVSGEELVDKISNLSLKPKKVLKKVSTENDKVLPKVDIPDSWESISADDIENVTKCGFMFNRKSGQFNTGLLWLVYT